MAALMASRPLKLLSSCRATIISRILCKTAARSSKFSVSTMSFCRYHVNCNKEFGFQHSEWNVCLHYNVGSHFVGMCADSEEIWTPLYFIFAHPRLVYQLWWLNGLVVLKFEQSQLPSNFQWMVLSNENKNVNIVCLYKNENCKGGFLQQATRANLHFSKCLSCPGEVLALVLSYRTAC